MSETNTFKFRSSRIDPEAIDRLAKLGGYETRAAYLRGLIRDDAERYGVSLHESER